MRLYLRKNGHVTSITVSDQLCHLLAVKLATRAVQYVWDHEFKGRKLVQGWINDLVQHTSDFGNQCLLFLIELHSANSELDVR